jgi:hypothetical protein
MAMPPPVFADRVIRIIATPIHAPRRSRYRQCIADPTS